MLLVIGLRNYLLLLKTLNLLRFSVIYLIGTCVPVKNTKQSFVLTCFDLARCLTEPQGEKCVFLRDGNGHVFLISEKKTVKGKT